MADVKRMAGVEIKNLTQPLQKGLGSVFSDIAKEILPSWDISLAFVGAAKARALNKKLRGKNYVPDVLSYVVGDKSAEIIICLSEARKQAPDYNLQPAIYNLFLFIHAALHIKGWVHGANMERCERTLLKRYEKAYSNRSRYRNVPSKNGRS